MADDSEQRDQRQQKHHHGRVRAPKDGRSRRHQIVRDRIVGSPWFERFIMLVTIINALVLWPWTDRAKSFSGTHRGYVDVYDVYPIVNFFFILVFTGEFVLKVCWDT